MLKKILLSLVNWVRKSQIISTIRRFDKDIDHTKWQGAEFFPNYFEPFKLVPPTGYNPQGVHRNNTIENDIGEVAAKITTEFKDKIVEFLGKDVRLDDIYMFWYDPDKRQEWSLSNSWHDDNVGHRIKIFVCFEGNGNTPTVVIPNSYNKPYKPNTSEILRFAGKRNINSNNGEIKLAYKSGDIAMFDTACLHRGLYEEPAAIRSVLVMEYIDRNKANIIAGKSPCGPGMSRTGKVVFKEGAYKALKNTGLIDDQLIKKENDEYIYSLLNLAR
ncbi:hypothetical protein OMP46_12720 [Acinetobacter baumannii]|uniref:hypothetical protein n=1 Tax=Acinetobacter baumannii TaxID=470 RepID=UPI000A392645|nr:hypothetical protein [Acinetobacter baumannii]MCW3180383.1 hypothetical protein [Acinetobacter baumannii]OTT28841.1 hypothetical protein CAS81_09210 [Acinetobacter baumannii]TPR80395.1 hypothetical protein FJV18_04905 [Acinetobacter baumannii]TPS14201.1 hypothetical protein FJV06_06085 [Acinetobacter baumannii]